MYKLDKEQSEKINSTDHIVFPLFGEGILQNIEYQVNKKLPNDKMVFSILKGTLYITLFLLESDMRRRRYFRGEINPEPRKFNLINIRKYFK